MSKNSLINNKNDKDGASTSKIKPFETKLKEVKTVSKKKKFVPPTKKTYDKPILEMSPAIKECLSQTFQSPERNLNVNQYLSPTSNIHEFSDKFNTFNDRNKTNESKVKIQDVVLQIPKVSNKISQMGNIPLNSYSQIEIDMVGNYYHEGQDNVNNVVANKIGDEVLKNKTRNSTLSSALLNSLTVLNDEELTMSQNILTPESLGNDNTKEQAINLSISRNCSTNSVTSLDKTYRNLDSSSFENRSNLVENITNCSKYIFNNVHDRSDKEHINPERSIHRIPIGDEYLKLFKNGDFNNNINDMNHLDFNVTISNNISESTKTNETKINERDKETKATKCVAMTTIHGDMGFMHNYSDFIKNSGIYVEEENEEVNYSILKIYEIYPTENKNVIKKKFAN